MSVGVADKRIGASGALVVMMTMKIALQGSGGEGQLISNMPYTCRVKAMLIRQSGLNKANNQLQGNIIGNFYDSALLLQY